MTKETEGQRKNRLHYEKIYNEALAAGPVDHATLSDSLRDFYSWQWCQIAHVVSAIGGFANFSHWVTEEVTNHFHVNEELQERLDSARKIIEYTAKEIPGVTPTQASMRATEWLMDHPVEEETEVLEEIASRPSVGSGSRRTNLFSKNWTLVNYNKNLYNLANEGFEYIGRFLQNIPAADSKYKDAVDYFNNRRQLIFNTSKENLNAKDEASLKKEGVTIQ